MFYLEQKEEWVLKAGIALMVVSNFISNLGLYGGRTSPAILVECCILTIVTVVLYRNHKISNKIPLFLLIVLWAIGFPAQVFADKFHGHEFVEDPRKYAVSVDCGYFSRA